MMKIVTRSDFGPLMIGFRHQASYQSAMTTTLAESALGSWTMMIHKLELVTPNPIEHA